MSVVTRSEGGHMHDIGEVFAGFTIEAMLGQGGMGTVYLARHPRLDRLDRKSVV